MGQYFYYTSKLDEAAKVLSGTTPYLGVRFKVDLEQVSWKWKYEFHLEVARKDLDKHMIPVAQAKIYIKDKMLEADIGDPEKHKNMTKDQINDYTARHYPWLDISATKMKKGEMINVILEEIRTHESEKYS